MNKKNSQRAIYYNKYSEMSRRSNKGVVSDKVYDITEVLDVFGKHQVLQYSLISLSIIFVSMVDLNYVFVAGDLNYRCVVPECEDVNSTAAYPRWWPKWTRDRCTKPIIKGDVQRGACTNTSFEENIGECSEWIYESNNTIVAEFDLACQPWKVKLVGTIHNIGVLITMMVSGWISDRYGRKWALIIFTTCTSVGYLKTFVSSWHVYIAVEFLESCISGGAYIPATVLMLEIVGRNKRILSGILFSCFVYFGECIFGFVAMLFPYWKYTVSVINIPCSLYIFCLFLINESPRWQIVNGKTNEAKINMTRIARTNNVKFNAEAWKQMNAGELKEKFNIKEHEVADSLKTIFSSKVIMKRLLVTSVCRFSSCLVYYGITINSVSLPGDKYVNFFLCSLMSFPGEFLYLYMMNKVGRKIPLQFGFLLSSIISIAFGFLNDTYKLTKISLFLINKMIISACCTGSITYTMELFPTSARGCLIGCCAFSSRVGCMLAPLTPILNLISNILAGVCFGALAALSCILLVLTPETKDLPLMDTVKQVEDSVIKGEKMKERFKEKDNLGFCDDFNVTTL